MMDTSKRSTKAGAGMAGFGSTRRVMLSDTLLNSPSDEVISVIGHELGHGKHMDIWGQTLSIVTTISLLFYISNWFFNTGIITRYFQVTTSFAVLYYVYYVVSSLLFFIWPLHNKLIRTQEYRADAYAVSLVNKSNPLVNFLKQFVSDYLLNVNPLPLYSTIFSSHPEPVERILAIQHYAEKHHIPAM
jgi:STE24 endopeptidase